MSKFCSNCGRELPDQAAFCDGCGYRMQQVAGQGFPQQSYQQTPGQEFPQQNYQQSWSGSPQQNVKQADTQKSKTPLILGLVAAALVLLAGGYFLSGSLKGKGGSGSSGEGYITKKEVETQEELPVTSAEKTDISEYENPEARETDEIRETVSEAAGVSDGDTLEPPVMEDFDWLYLEMWDDAEYISDFDEITGKWKGCIHYYQDEDEMELVYAEVKGTADQVELVVDPYEMYYNGEPPVDESGIDDFSFSGDFDSGWLRLDQGPGVLECSVIYYHEDKEYMGGQVAFPDGTRAVVGFVRPRR